MNIRLSNLDKLLVKSGIVSLMIATLVASATTTGTTTNDTTTNSPTTTVDSDATPTYYSLALISPSETSGTYTATNDLKEISADLTFRASSAYYSNGSFVKVDGHEIKAKYGKTETSNSGVATAFTLKAREFTGILGSATQFREYETSEKVFTQTELDKLNDLRVEIASLASALQADSTNVSIKQQLNAKLAELEVLVPTGGLYISLDELANGDGYFGLFANQEDGGYKQISGIYALADGQSVGDYATVKAAAGANTYTYDATFNGGGMVSGLLTDLTDDTGAISANFDTQQLTGTFSDVHNSGRTEEGEIAFSGVMASGADGIMFVTNSATYTNNTGVLDDMTGSAEAVFVGDDGSGILGNVNLTNAASDQAVVGAFGGDKN